MKISQRTTRHISKTGKSNSSCVLYPVDTYISNADRGGSSTSHGFPWQTLTNIPGNPMVVSSCAKLPGRAVSSEIFFRGGQFSYQNSREFPWWPNPARNVTGIIDRPRARPWKERLDVKNTHLVHKVSVISYAVFFC